MKRDPNDRKTSEKIHEVFAKELIFGFLKFLNVMICKHFLLKELKAIRSKILLSKENIDEYMKERDGFKMTFESLLHINDDAFDSKELATLDLSHNKLTLIEEANIFDKLSNLQELRLNNNRIESLPSTLFSCLDKLKVLWLYHDQLKALGDDVFKALKNLQTLSIHNNKIETITSESLFSSLVSLENIDLSHNQLATISEALFSNLVNLRELNLQHNLIEELKQNTFKGLEQLMTIKLNNNKLSSIDGIEFNLDNLISDLDLSMNMIVSINLESNPFQKLSNLTQLSLRGNGLESFDLELFASLDNLVDFDVSENKIAKIENGQSEKCLNSLENLDLSGNRLETISKEFWKRMPGLATIKLDNNKISTVEADSFFGLEDLEELYLENNKFDAFEFVTNLFSKEHKINILNLSGNLNLESIKTVVIPSWSKTIIQSTYSNSNRNVTLVS